MKKALTRIPCPPWHGFILLLSLYIFFSYST
jgi:hypothetical protein